MLCNGWYIFRTLSIIVDLDIFRNIHVLFRHIKPYCGIFKTLDLFRILLRHTLEYSECCVTLTFWEPCHIQNSGIFRTQDISRTLSRHTLDYSECCVTLAYWEPCHIQIFAIFRVLPCLGPEAYTENCFFRFIQAFSKMIVLITLRKLTGKAHV